ncbi:MAG: DUF433 domain-containing protein [Chloroflexi bacterium]|nr:DUF433 domain-containing protein [Chloroflexota bacterium]
MQAFSRITFDPDVMGGRPCVRGLPITVKLLLTMVADGMSVQEITELYPCVEPHDIGQALRYAQWLTEENVGHVELARA